MSYFNKKGFTLIEIIVTVGIIGILSTVALISFRNTRANARDAVRVSNIDQVMTALQLYRNETSIYPTALMAGQPLQSGSLTFLSSVPASPSPRTDGGCADKGYYYEKIPTGYQITFCLGADTGHLKKGINVCINGECQSAGALKVFDKEGNEYGTVGIGQQLWLSQNLQSKVKPDGTCINGGEPPCPDATVDDDPSSPRLCFGNEEENCDQYGALYTWAAAMDGSTTPGAQGICPAGWHVPSDAEWHTLEAYLADSGSSCDPNREDSQCDTAGVKLGSGGSSGMNILLAGYHHVNNFYNGSGFNDIGYAWSSSPVSSNAWMRSISGQQSPGTTIYPSVARAALEQADSLSLRCIKNYQ